uniref:Uncharacterized protein n=1 Tax=Takifugu rubripes TaxID=31033 RepID=A0A3B5K4C2_TAKRU
FYMNSIPSYFTSPILVSGRRMRPSSVKAMMYVEIFPPSSSDLRATMIWSSVLVVGDPVLVTHVPSEAHHLHPLRVVVDKLARGGRPLLPQPADPEVPVLHRHPLSFEPCQQKGERTQKTQLVKGS